MPRRRKKKVTVSDDVNHTKIAIPTPPEVAGAAVDGDTNRYATMLWWTASSAAMQLRTTVVSYEGVIMLHVVEILWCCVVVDTYMSGVSWWRIRATALKYVCVVCLLVNYVAFRIGVDMEVIGDDAVTRRDLTITIMYTLSNAVVLIIRRVPWLIDR